MKSNHIFRFIKETVKEKKLLCFFLMVTVIASVATALLPPLVLEKIVNALTAKKSIRFSMALLYFGLTVLSGVLESGREAVLCVFGQKVTHGMRSKLSAKLSLLPADTITKQEPGAIVSRIIGDVDTVESLFTSGIISMVADAVKLLSIFAVIFVKNLGLFLMLLVIVPFIFVFTRLVQKRMLKAQLDNREAVARATGQVPETIRCIRTVHLLCKEKYMKKKYAKAIDDGYAAIEKNNFYQAVYSPVIQIFNVVTVAVAMLLSSSQNTEIMTVFGMSAGTAVAVINYISLIFSPIESLGMEIQTIQSAIAGVHRINDFLDLPERKVSVCEVKEKCGPTIEIKDVTFAYKDSGAILKDFNLTINAEEHITILGRTGAGKSTIFKLILGLYAPQSGKVLINGTAAAEIPDEKRRKIFGCVEQSFHMVPGNIKDQITLFDERISFEDVRRAAELVGLDKTINSLPEKYNTVCTESVFSQGQWQLLSIARAVAANPEILLLDEITASLDSDTERSVLDVLSKAAANRTVLSISHRMFRHVGGRSISIE